MASEAVSSASEAGTSEAVSSASEAGTSEAGTSASEAVATVKQNKLIFVPSGRLGNAIFRYMACAVVNILNPRLEYTLLDDFQPEEKDDFTYYLGLDHQGDDAYHSSEKDLVKMQKRTLEDNMILGFNTLGFFKHTIDIDNLTSNKFINKENGQGLYVKNKITLTDDNFFQLFYKKLEYFDVHMNGFFQFGYIYLKYKAQILHYMEQHKDTHCIQTDLKERFLMRELLADMVLPPAKKYDIAIHIRLGDFNGRPDFIECEYYLHLFESLKDRFSEGKICIVYQPTERLADGEYIKTCLDWFESNGIGVTVESNSVLIDFNIMKQAQRLICSMSTLAWAAAYLSKEVQECYMPNYHFYGSERAAFFFHQPVNNTILYPVKTTPDLLGQLKTYMVTLPEYTGRLAAQDDLIHQCAVIGLHVEPYYGVNGREIEIYDAASKHTQIKHITWKDTTYFYDMRVRINGTHMSKGEFGCAWSHLNLLRQLCAEPSINYYLILEDDVELVKPVDELYQLLQNVPADADFCHLAKSDWYPFVLTQAANAYFSECEKRFFNKTTAYLVTKKGAAKILAYTQNSINVPVDDLYNMIYRLTSNFRFYVPPTYFFKERDNILSSIKEIDRVGLKERCY
jgi:GR25 family glycosyltransferase involved in LPS biosynthesis